MLYEYVYASSLVYGFSCIITCKIRRCIFASPSYGKYEYIPDVVYIRVLVIIDVDLVLFTAGMSAKGLLASGHRKMKQCTWLCWRIRCRILVYSTAVILLLLPTRCEQHVVRCARRPLWVVKSAGSRTTIAAAAPAVVSSGIIHAGTSATPARLRDTW